MTLNTSIRITNASVGVTGRTVFDEMRRLIGADDRFTYRRREPEGKYSPHPQLAMDLGQGLCALMDVEWGADGPCTPHRWCDPEDHDEGYPPERCGPDYAVEVGIDTGYAYKAVNGAGCADLHAHLITALGKWLDERGVDWWWHDEFRGTWHQRYEHLADFGDATRGAPDLPVTRELDAFAWPTGTTAR